MSVNNRYYELAEQAARTGEVSFLKHCIDEILRDSTSNGSIPEFSRIFKTLFDARLHFLHRHTDGSPEAHIEDIPTDLLQILRDLDNLSDLVMAVAEGQPITDAVRRIQRLGAHPIRPK